jgi:hypothetical protein
MDLVTWLSQELKIGLGEWQRGTDSGDDQLCRRACVRQLRALREAAKQLTGNPNSTEPLAQLMSALLAASQGTAHPLLKPLHREGGRPPADLLPQLKRARAAAALDRLIETGLTRDEAANRVIGNLHQAQANIFNGSGQAARTELIRLRDRLKSRRGGPAANFYWKSLHEVQGQPPEQGAKWLLAGFSNIDAA